MKKIKIFIASSIEEFKLDRIEIGNFFRRLNDFYLERGLYFTLIMCEDLDNAINNGRKQEEYNREIIVSDLVFFLFCTKTGQYTLEEFDIALESFKKAGRPKIVTYFKIASEPPTEEINRFMTRLDKEVGQYYNVYGHIDTLKLGMMMQIQLMGLDGFDIRLDNGKALQSGTELLDLGQIEMINGNDGLTKLKKEHAELEIEFISAKSAYIENPDDADAYEKFFGVSKKYNESRSAVREFESNLYKMIEGMFIQTSGGRLSRRQAEGYRLMERGKFREAKVVLDFNDIAEEARLEAEQADNALISLQVRVNEQLQLKDINTALGDWAAVDASYNEAVRLEERYNIPKKAMLDYTQFLYRQNRFGDCEAVAKNLEYYQNNPVKPASDHEKGLLFCLLGNIFRKTQRYDEAESILKTSLRIRAKLVEREGGGALKREMGNCLSNLGNLYFICRRYAEAEETFKSALQIIEGLEEDYPGEYENDLAELYILLGNIFYMTARMAEAEELYLRGAAIYKKITDMPDEIGSALARALMNLGNVYKDTRQFNKSGEAYEESQGILYGLAMINPEAYEPEYVKCCGNLGQLQNYTGKTDEAEETLNKALDIQKRLARRDFNAHGPILAWLHNTIGFLNYTAGDMDGAKTMFSASLAARKTLAEKNPGEHEYYLAECHNNLGEVLRETRNFSEAEGHYEDAAAIYARIAENNPSTVEPRLAEVYYSLGCLYDEAGDGEKAAANFGSALGLFVKYEKESESCAEQANAARERIGKIKTSA